MRICCFTYRVVYCKLTLGFGLSDRENKTFKEQEFSNILETKRLTVKIINRLVMIKIVISCSPNYQCMTVLTLLILLLLSTNPMKRPKPDTERRQKVLNAERLLSTLCC